MIALFASYYAAFWTIVGFGIYLFIGVSFTALTMDRNRLDYFRSTDNLSELGFLVLFWPIFMFGLLGSGFLAALAYSVVWLKDNISNKEKK